MSLAGQLPLARIKNMKVKVHRTLLVLVALPLLYGQEATKSDDLGIGFGAPTPQQLTRRIFAAERDMIERLRDTSPILETYLQSLWPNTTEQSPIDDAY